MLLLLVAPLCFSTPASAQIDLSVVPGKAIHYIQSPTRNIFTGRPSNPIYPASPSITVMPNGHYIVAHDLFHGSGHNNNRTTHIRRSTDKGNTWHHRATISNAFWSTVFEHNGDLYLWGYPKDSDTSGSQRGIWIRRSTDEGATWTTPTNANNGILRDDDDYGGTPNTPVIHDGRIWIAQGGKRVMSAPVNANLLQASSWTLTNTANTNNHGPLGNGLVITEAQIVASPQTGVVILPKIGDLPNTVLLRVNPADSSQIFNANANGWVSLPGGEKKFAAQYDSASGRFFVLSNIVPDVHAGVTTPALTRTTGALLSSRDLVNWEVEKIFLYTNNIDNGNWGEGFQYFQFAIDDTDGDGQRDDLAIVSRTAYRVGQGQRDPPRGHDNNLITFHTIPNFRTARPDQYMRIENGTVMRYERTENHHIPLGRFAIGNSFAGTALTNPNAISADSAGNVYIREASGRILYFEREGHFLRTVSALPSGMEWSTTTRNLPPPLLERRAWINTQNRSDWANPKNWLYWGRADTNAEIARFGATHTGTAYVDINSGENFTVKGLYFHSPNNFIIDKGGNLTLEANSGRSTLTVLDGGTHQLRVSVRLNSDTYADIANNALEFRALLNLNGKRLYKGGLGRLSIMSTLTMNGGAFVLDGYSPITFASGQSFTLNGNLVFEPHPSLSLSQGSSFQLINQAANLGSARFNNVVLPALPSTLVWDTSTLYTNGTVRIAAVPVPAVSIQATKATANEYGSDNQLIFTVTRTAPTTNAVTVSLTAAGTAQSGTHYSGMRSSLTLGAGQSSATLTLAAHADTLTEGNKTVIIRVASGAGYTVGSPAQATGTIIDRPSHAFYRQHISDPAKRGAYDDADADGVPNILEYYLNTNPSDGNSRETLTLEALNANTYEVTYSRATSRPDVGGALQWSTDLKNWYESGQANGTTSVTITEQITGSGAGRETVRATLHLTTAETKSLFVRLVVW